jgi:hypothetical protein
MGTVNTAEVCETLAVCPEPRCNEGQCEVRVETATQFKVSWATCKVCDGKGVVPIWKAVQWRASNPSRRKISGVMSRGGF